MADAMPAPRLTQNKPAAENGVLAGFKRHELRHHFRPAAIGELAGAHLVSGAVGPKLFAEAGVGEKTARGGKFVFVNQNAPLESTDRALEHAYVLIGDHVRNSRAREQRLDGRDRHRVVGSHEFAQRLSSAAIRRPSLLSARTTRRTIPHCPSRAIRSRRPRQGTSPPLPP